MRDRHAGSTLLTLVLLLIVIGVLGGAGWYVWHRQQPTGTAMPVSSNQPTTQSQNTGWNTTATSGKGAYHITFPDGWKVQRDTNSDAFMIGGTEQPTVKLGSPAVVTSAAFGSDGPVILFISAADGDAAVPMGTASDFTLENGKTNPIQGKKYAYDYTADEAEGSFVGQQRLKGDRDYTYLFNLPDGKVLRVFYAVYGSDPRNNIATIDALVRTIRLSAS